jgi:uncharacterized membrane-anchored protein YhcB (DUF1043 family)
MDRVEERRSPVAFAVMAFVAGFGAGFLARRVAENREPESVERLVRLCDDRARQLDRHAERLAEHFRAQEA